MVRVFTKDCNLVESIAKDHDISRGDLIKLDDSFAVALEDAKVGSSFSAAISGAFLLPKDTGYIEQGIKVYWKCHDDSSDLKGGFVTKKKENNYFLGVSALAASPVDKDILVRINMK